MLKKCKHFSSSCLNLNDGNKRGAFPSLRLISEEKGIILEVVKVDEGIISKGHAIHMASHS